MRERLDAVAATRQMTAAALARKAIRTFLAQQSSDVRVAPDGIVSRDVRISKVTLRMSAGHANALATRARSADVSQGAYVAGLIDGMPQPPLPPDHAHAVAALVGSTDQLSAIGVDLNAFMRLLARGSFPETMRYRAGILSLSEDVRRHLTVASALTAELQSARRYR